MGIQIQVKCRRCRMFLLSEESIINLDGSPIQDNQTGLDCSNLSGLAKTHLFVSPDLAPSWILDTIAQSSYTQGKILCPKCQGRIGSFSFITPAHKSSNGQTIQPPVHFLRDRVDVTNNADKHRLTALVVDCSSGDATTTSDTANLINANMVKIKDTQPVFDQELNLEVCDDSVNQTSHQECLTGEPCSCKSYCDDIDQTLHLEWLFGEHSFAGETMAEPVASDNDTQEDLLTLNTLAAEGAGGSEGSPSSITSRLGTCRAQGRGTARLQVSSRGQAGTGVPPQGHTPMLKSRRQRRRERRAREMDDLEEDLHQLNASRVDNHLWWNSFAALYNQKPEKPVHLCSLPARRKKKTDTRSDKEKAEKKEKEEQMLQAEEVPWEHTCPMCMEVMLTPYTTLPCKHHFCELCLRRLGSIRTPSTTDCPLCRQRITKCVWNKKMEKAISAQSPMHLAARRQEEKQLRNSNKRFLKLPLPGGSIQFPSRSFPARHVHGRRSNCTMIVVSIFLLLLVLFVIALAYVGISLCRLVLSYAASLFDWVTVSLTGERLWSEFMGMESRVATVSSVFVLYLVCSFLVKYLNVFRGILYQ